MCVIDCPCLCFIFMFKTVAISNRSVSIDSSVIVRRFGDHLGWDTHIPVRGYADGVYRDRLYFAKDQSYSRRDAD